MNPKSILIATAAATLFLSGAVPARADHPEGGDKVPCFGINSCKGTGGCASAKSTCAGKNACKGQGVSEVSAAECKEKGGSVVPEKDRMK